MTEFQRKINVSHVIQYAMYPTSLGLRPYALGKQLAMRWFSFGAFTCHLEGSSFTSWWLYMVMVYPDKIP